MRLKKLKKMADIKAANYYLELNPAVTWKKEMSKKKDNEVLV